MKNSLKTVCEQSELEVRGAKTATHLLMERAPYSPRASVALSALAGVHWLRAITWALYKRIVLRGANAEETASNPKAYVAKRTIELCVLFLAFTLSSAVLLHGQAPLVAPVANVPHLINFSGKLTDTQGKGSKRVEGITFAIYKNQEGGAALWIETQNVTLDARGSYSVSLGFTTNEGLPADLFASGEARWLGVQVSGQAEQPRVLLLSVPYALKAADAETLGGLPASAFVLAAPSIMGSGIAGTTENTSNTSAATPAAAITGSGTKNLIPLWTGASTQGNSVVAQTGSGSTAKIGINTTAPATTLDVKGAGTVRGVLSLPATAAATAAAGKNSQPLSLAASTFNSSSGTAINELFNWQAEPAANNTNAPSATLNLLFGSGTAKPKETGLKIASNGQITFASGQTFPGGNGTGTVTSVGLSVPSSDFKVTGSPVTSSGTLALSWIVGPTAANVANAIVKRDATGGFLAGPISATGFSGGTAVLGTTTTGLALQGMATTSGDGVYGQSDSGTAIFGRSKTGTGVYGVSASFPGVSGASASNYAIDGTSESSSGVHGYSVSSHGVFGEAHTTSGFGVIGTNSAAGGISVYGANSAPGGVGVYGNAPIGLYGNSTAGSAGVYGQSVGGWGLDGFGYSGGTGVLAGTDSAGGFAGWFNGNVNIDGNLSKSGGSFKIDHPLDPANKYLYHSFVESPDMMNIYNGNVTTNASGEAVVALPEWFETLNSDFRYQLTVLGQFAQAIVARKVANHQFAIKTDKPNVEVSWQVTGIRQDAWANAHRIPVEEQKSVKERGFYLHPELFGAPEEKGVLWTRDPQAMKQWKDAKLAAIPQQANPAKP